MDASISVVLPKRWAPDLVTLIIFNFARAGAMRVL